MVNVSSPVAVVDSESLWRLHVRARRSLVDGNGPLPSWTRCRGGNGQSSSSLALLWWPFVTDVVIPVNASICK
jgi:hypothetical protein